MSQTIQTLHVKRGAIKRKITEFHTFVKRLSEVDPISQKDRIMLETRLAKLDQFFEQMQEIQNQIYEIAENETIPEEENYISEFEETYYAVLAEAQILLKPSPDSQEILEDLASEAGSSISIPRGRSGDTLQNVKLPTISLPKFGGQFTRWLEFHDTFVSLIHDNESLGNVQKFHYLKASLENEAAEIIKSLQMSSENYTIAWNLLCNRYTNKKLLIQNHIRELFTLSEITKESSSNLRELLDTTVKSLRSLNALGQPVDNWDPLIIYLITSKLDKQTAREWEAHRTNDELPSLEELKTFLNNKADLLENLAHRYNTHSHNSKPNNSQTQINKSFNQKHFKTSKSFITSTSNITCYYCQENHAIYNCDKFKSLPLPERINQVSSLKLCGNCLRNNHKLEDCKSNSCRKCNKKHNTLLHSTKENALNQVFSASVTLKNTTHVLLATVLVNILDKQGKLLTVRALLDSASQSHFITLETIQKLGLTAERTDIYVQGINQVASSVKGKCLIRLKSQVGKFETKIPCLIVDNISTRLPSTELDFGELNLPKNIILADPTFNKPGKIDLLIGTQLFWNLLADGRIKLLNDSLVLQNTELGWILSGSTNFPHALTSNSRCFLINTFEVRDQLKQFWEIEECPSKPSFSTEEKACEEHFTKNTYRDETGRFVVSIPFKDNALHLGESKSMATKRFLSLERRLCQDTKLKLAYTDFMNEYEQLHHMSRVNDIEDSDPHYYMPHHGVINEFSKTTKLRVVFDGSCPSSNGVSINHLQMVGPTLQSDLIEILLRFRQNKIAVSSDITKMYRQVLVNPKDRKYQRILWRSSPDNDLETYELNTVTYGTASAPYLATRCVIEISNQYSDQFPEASQVIAADTYVDDVLSTFPSTEHAIKTCKQIIQILNSAHFQLHKWVSNDETLLESLGVQRGNQEQVRLSQTDISKTLGVYWCPLNDTLGYHAPNHTNLTSSELTKRHILSSLSKVFDPLGLLSPIIIIGKIILQSIWLEKTDWDEAVSKPICDKWLRLQSELSILGQFKIPRNVLCENPSRVEIHGFCDASEQAYGACIYFKSSNSSGNVAVHLLCAKSKVAPLKQLTIPRLELCGAHLLSKLITLVKNSTRIPINQIYLWTDSTIVLGWLNTSPNALKVFVSHRIAYIQESCKEATWLHVPTNFNPADLLSRGVFPRDLQSAQLWWHGPVWLQSEPPLWPCTSFKITESLPELKKVENCFITTHLQSIIDWKRFSKFSRIVRSTAYVFRFIHNCKHDNKKTGVLKPDELNRALNYLIKSIQSEHFVHELSCMMKNKPLPAKSKIITLNPFLDSDNLLRVGGRLQESQLSFNEKHPIILPQHHLTSLFFRHTHLQLGHAGPQHLLSSVRTKYWPLRGKSLAKLTVHKCIRCFRCKPKAMNPLMGNLPASRVTQSFPFQFVGVDYAGPLTIKDKMSRGWKPQKCYISLFICFSTKAVHIELVPNLTTEAFIACLRRFIARRGKPEKIISDNAKNFLAASKELRGFIDINISQNRIEEVMINEGITWENIPPGSPHFGGLWEAGIKSCKHHLKRLLGNALLTFEQLYSVLTQIESIMNSRPLTELSSDPNDLSCLTPAHFLIGRSITSIPEPSLMDIPVNRLSQYQRLQQIVQSFWSRWHSEYLHSLQQRKKWAKHQANIAIGTMVLIKNENQPPLSWCLGRIIVTYPGADGVVRVVQVKTISGVYKRAVSKIYPLPIEQSDCVTT